MTQTERRIDSVSRPGQRATPRQVAEGYLQAVAAFQSDTTSTDALNAATALFAEDATWTIAGDTARVPQIGQRSGRAGVASFLTALATATEPVAFDVHRIVEDGETAVILGTLATRVKATGKIMDSAFAIVLTVRDGQITKGEMLEDSWAASEAFR